MIAAQNIQMVQNAELTRLEESLENICEAPADGGAVELIARRPGVDEREVLSEARLDVCAEPTAASWCLG